MEELLHATSAFGRKYSHPGKAPQFLSRLADSANKPQESVRDKIVLCFPRWFRAIPCFRASVHSVHAVRNPYWFVVLPVRNTYNARHELWLTRTGRAHTHRIYGSFAPCMWAYMLLMAELPSFRWPSGGFALGVVRNPYWSPVLRVRNPYWTSERLGTPVEDAHLLAPLEPSDCPIYCSGEPSWVILVYVGSTGAHASAPERLEG